jgi:hypothetical protein
MRRELREKKWEILVGNELWGERMREGIGSSEDEGEDIEKTSKSFERY